jgi:calcium/calmodulin-dependent protein kinase I
MFVFLVSVPFAIPQQTQQLKSGSFATVCRGTHRATGRKVAIKCVLRKELPPSDDAAIYDEVAILSSLSHPHIVPLIDFFDEKDCYFLVMELMSGGDLFDRIGKKKSYSEADARDLIVKMLKAVAYCHMRKIAHCDMKPKNLLLMSDDNDSFIKLADFGFAARVHAPKSLSKQCGTPFFVAPEILLRKGYDQQSDMWSVGCIIYLLLAGNLPFMGRSQKELFRKIVAGKYEFEGEDWEHISDDAKDLVRKCLVLNPDDRITASQAVRHKWLKASRDRLSMISLQSTSQRLKTFNARMKLRSAMIAVDWVSSLKRLSWTNRNDNPHSRSNASGSSGGSGGGSGSGGGGGGSNPLMAAARKMKAQEGAVNGSAK